MPLAIQPDDGLREYIADQLEIIHAIPDGILLANYPSHDETSLCWCHPRPMWGYRGTLLAHKDLTSGEFDS
jgi:hypothetical protein